MTRPLNPLLLEELNDLRAFYDELGGHWSDTVGGSDEEEHTRWVRFMWQERENPTVDSLWQIFYRHLDAQQAEDSEGYETDSTESEEGSCGKLEPDSDEDADWFGQMDAADSDEETTENRVYEENEEWKDDVKVESE
ncbi:hypothetical protein V5O48_009476 [Marasmius crinis-equi]|uniref:Uncharacterized protein n=1 Tax=Marasmius crinis-equi TaxID=585013 RepID=A0ABR3FBM0_9AGAR